MDAMSQLKKAYDEKGRIKYKRPYEEGEVVGPTEYYKYDENGELKDQ